MDMEYCSYMVTEDAQQQQQQHSLSRDSAVRGASELTDKHVRYKEALAANLLYQSPEKPSKTSLLHFHSSTSSSGSSGASGGSGDSESTCSPRSSTSAGMTSPYVPRASHHSLQQLGRLHSPLAEPTAAAAARRRHIPSAPTRILDAPELRDDYYLNLVSWGDNNVLAVALDQVVYLYNTASGAIQEVRACTARNDYVTSVAWVSEAGGAERLAVGTFGAELQVWDTLTTTKVRTLRGHRERIGALAWSGSSSSGGVLASGSRDTKILHHDLRRDRHVVATLLGHQQEVCGLAWSPDARTLASGGNDNCLCLWDAAKSGRASSAASRSSSSSTRGSCGIAPRHKLLQHRAAVKALAWCPWERHLLASGGGTADRTIKFWHSASGKLVQSVNAGSQVCGLVWSRSERELLSSHGFSQNELCLWRYPSMTRVREFTGHTARVLHLAMSPDGSSVVSAAADETLRFWNVFASATHAAPARLSDKLLLSSAVIR